MNCQVAGGDAHLEVKQKYFFYFLECNKRTKFLVQTTSFEKSIITHVSCYTDKTITNDFATCL